MQSVVVTAGKLSIFNLAKKLSEDLFLQELNYSFFADACKYIIGDRECGSDEPDYPLWRRVVAYGSVHSPVTLLPMTKGQEQYETQKAGSNTRIGRLK